MSKEKLSLNGNKLLSDGYIVIDIEYLKLLDYLKQPFPKYSNEKCNSDMEDIRNVHDQVSAEM